MSLLSFFRLLPALAVYSALHGQSSDASLQVPEGFDVHPFAEGLQSVWGLAFGPDGHLYASLPGEGRVIRIIDLDGDGVADSVAPVIDGLERPRAIAFHGVDLWIAEATRIVRLDDAVDDAPASSLSVVVAPLPGGNAAISSFVFDPTGNALFVAFAASCDLCREDDPRLGAIVRYELDGSGGQVWAMGLHDVAGMSFVPATGELWVTDVARGGLGDAIPPDELNAVHPGRHYGWPYCYGARVPYPEFGDPARCDRTEPPVHAFPAGSAPGGITFYGGATFPSDYRGDAFVALRGSPDRSSVAGSRVVRLRVIAGHPVDVRDFITGWPNGAGSAGRPVLLLVGPEGALYVSDDAGHRIWRVTGSRARTTAAR